MRGLPSSAVCGCACETDPAATASRAADPHRPAVITATPNVVAVLEAVRDGHDYSLAIATKTGLNSRSVYALLKRLSGAGWLEYELEEHTVSAMARRQPRRVYRLTRGAHDELP